MNEKLFGFTVYDEFTDTYGSQVTVQESSAAQDARCWIFTEGESFSPGGGAAHLNVEQARRVRDALDAFIREHSEDTETREGGTAR